jgi:hypothetical protein
MGHLSTTELLEACDAAESSRSGGAAAHLSTCASCHRQVAELQGMLRAARDAAIPEPSPLFWDHLSARIRAEIASAPVPPTTRVFDAVSLRRFALPLLACGLVVVLAIGFMRTGRVRGSSIGNGSNASLTGTAASDSAQTSEDPSFSFVADLASGLDWDVAAEAGLNAPDAAVDAALMGLNARERAELQKLLRDELARPGA